MNTLITQLIQSMRSTFSEQPWYGESVLQKLRSIDHGLVNRKVQGSNSIGGLVAHMIQWRKFAIEKLQGNESFDITLNTASDWPAIQVDDHTSWLDLLQQLEQTQEEILALLVSLNDDFLKEKTPGKDYNNLELLEGIIQHDVYHLGQIGVLNSQLLRMK